jgi:hypothetical protein
MHTHTHTHTLPRQSALQRTHCTPLDANFQTCCAKSCLRPFASVTTVNGLLSRGRMWVLSRQQFGAHLAAADVRHPHTLLDIGAGDGNVTKELASHFSGTVSVTEADAVMRWRLRRRGYRCLEVDAWENEAPHDVISCLNVLDRCVSAVC